MLEANMRARTFYLRYGFSETSGRMYSSLGKLPEIRLIAPLM
ncbi:hypothetical protein JOF29_001344 [Kribbella aluminosa]|uniref:Acetyltransferase n=1 Tax=Kribbella aluminosa TaxID=416017 RepID=A0ABS4UFC2_9ACTN|nr:hypothetical protein [Kribbella aluminosa]MBP2350261.1 hypothetical protein [Kribbella aluminosa]